MVHSYGSISVQRGQAQRDNIDIITGILARDGVIGMFPEGTRNKGGLIRAKGGVAIPIRQRFHLPVKFVGIGEKETDLEPFNVDDYVDALFDDVA